MSATLEELKSTISALPLSQRAELAHYLLRTLETPDEGAASEWLALAEQRMEVVRSGGVVGIPAAQVLQRPLTVGKLNVFLQSLPSLGDDAEDFAQDVRDVCNEFRGKADRHADKEESP